MKTVLRGALAALVGTAAMTAAQGRGGAAPRRACRRARAAVGEAFACFSPGEAWVH